MSNPTVKHIYGRYETFDVKCHDLEDKVKVLTSQVGNLKNFRNTLKKLRDMCKEINFNGWTPPKHSLHHDSQHTLRDENKYLTKHNNYNHRVRQDERDITRGSIDAPSFEVRLNKCILWMWLRFWYGMNHIERTQLALKLLSNGETNKKSQNCYSCPVSVLPPHHSRSYYWDGQ